MSTSVSIGVTAEAVTVVCDDDGGFLSRRIRTILQNLSGATTGSDDSGHFDVPHTVFAGLDDEVIALLDGPSRYPFRMEVDCDGELSSVDFRFIVRFLDFDGRPLVSARRIGCIIDLGILRYTLNSAQYCIAEMSTLEIEPVKAGHKSQILHERLRTLAELKQHVRAARCHLCDYLASQEILVPNTIVPELKSDEAGRFRLMPRPVRLTDSGTEGDVYSPQLSEEEIDEFQRRVRGQEHRKTHTVSRPNGSRLRILAGTEIQDALEEIGQLEELTPEEITEFVDNPGQFLTSPLFRLEEFSQRVTEAAVLKFVTNLGVSKGKMSFDWDQLNLVLTSDDDNDGLVLPVESTSDLIKLKNAFERAVERNSQFILYKGSAFQRNDSEIVATLADATAALVLKGVTIGDIEEAKARAKSRGYVGLRILDNIEELGFRYDANTVGLDLLNCVLPHELRPEITLYEFQRAGIAWMQKLVTGASGGVLADDMGLGKTLQLLCFLLWNRSRSPLKPNLVIVPVTLIENWLSEIESKFDLDTELTILTLYGDFLRDHSTRGAIIKQRDGRIVKLPNKKILSDAAIAQIREAQIVLTNYETVRDYQVSLASIEFETIVCDEAQRIKNPTTHTTNAIKSLNSPFRIASTATPVENSLTDFWCISDFVRPGLLGSLSDFNAKYANDEDDPGTAGRLEELRSHVRNCDLMLRRTKEEELKNLPPKYEVFQLIPMSSRQEKLYARFADIAANDKRQVLPVLISLIALSSHPALCLPGGVLNRPCADLKQECPKLNWVLEVLKAIEAKGEKALIFTRFRKMQDILQFCITDEFRHLNSPVIINGDTPPRSRKQLVDTFNGSDGFNVMILSPEAAGVGLNITGANHVIHYTRLWNPAKENQATDRTYRIGQTREVHVYYPISVLSENDSLRGQSVEERINELLLAKRSLMKEVLVPSEKLTIKETELASIFAYTSAPHELPSLSEQDIRECSVAQRRQIIRKLFTASGNVVIDGEGERGSVIDLVIVDRQARCGVLVSCAKENSDLSALATAMHIETRDYAERHRFDDVRCVIVYDAIRGEVELSEHVEYWTLADLCTRINNAKGDIELPLNEDMILELADMAENASGGVFGLGDHQQDRQ